MKSTTLLSGLLALGLAPVALGTTYTLDPLHSYVEWKINHFGFSNPSGKWFAEGKIDYDPRNPAASRVDATLKLSEGVSGIPDLDKHLKGKLFFNVEQYPTATFVSDKVAVNNNLITKVHGKLTLLGVTKAVILDVKQNQQGKNPINDKDTIGFSATAQLKRSDFGIKTLLPGISDEVNLSIEVEAS